MPSRLPVLPAPKMTPAGSGPRARAGAPGQSAPGRVRRPRTRVVAGLLVAVVLVFAAAPGVSTGASATGSSCTHPFIRHATIATGNGDYRHVVIKHTEKILGNFRVLDTWTWHTRYGAVVCQPPTFHWRGKTVKLKSGRTSGSYSIIYHTIGHEDPFPLLTIHARVG